MSRYLKQLGHYASTNLNTASAVWSSRSTQNTTKWVGLTYSLASGWGSDAQCTNLNIQLVLLSPTPLSSACMVLDLQDATLPSKFHPPNVFPQKENSQEPCKLTFELFFQN